MQRGQIVGVELAGVELLGGLAKEACPFAVARHSVARDLDLDAALGDLHC